MEQVFPRIDNPADWAPVEGRMFAVYAEMTGEMVEAKNGFAAAGEAAEWAAETFGSGNWQVVEYDS